jgi:hypothetical protein
MELAKSGYTKGYPVVKTTISNNGERYQKKYNTFCMKLYSAEKAPDAIRGKGIIQRMVKLRCIAGEPAHDILEVVNPMGDDEHSDLLKELHRVRNMLLCYRLVHRNDKISNITINLKNREKQLFKPVLRLFQNTKTMPQLSIVISNYINERRKTKLSGLHSFLIQLVDDMMTDKGYGNIGVALAETVELDTSDIWAKVQSRTSGQFQSEHPLTYETVEFGPVSQKNCGRAYLLCKDKQDEKHESLT